MSDKPLKHYLFASDFDQTLTFDDSGYVLSELVGIPTAEFESKAQGMAKMTLTGGPGHPLHPGEDAAIRQSRLSRGRDRPAQQGVQHGAGEGARLRHQRHGRRASGLCRHPAQALGRADAQSEGGAAGAVAANLEPADGARACPSRRPRCRARPAARRCNSSSPPRATSASSRTCLPTSRSRRAKAACSSSPTPISASRRRRSSSRSITTRPTGSASPWPISATRSRRCSAATTSICSTCTGGAIRSFRRCRASSG